MNDCIVQFEYVSGIILRHGPAGRGQIRKMLRGRKFVEVENSINGGNVWEKELEKGSVLTARIVYLAPLKDFHPRNSR